MCARMSHICAMHEHTSRGTNPSHLARIGGQSMARTGGWVCGSDVEVGAVVLPLVLHCHGSHHSQVSSSV